MVPSRSEGRVGEQARSPTAMNVLRTPDLIGFGRSDKPADRHDYSYGLHVHTVDDMVAYLQLKADLNRALYERCALPKLEITDAHRDWNGAHRSIEEFLELRQTEI